MQLLTAFSILLGLVSGAFAATPPAGQVFFWGRNIGGQGLETPISWESNCAARVTMKGRPLNDAVAVAAGSSHALALMRDGTVFGWGFNQYGQATGSRQGAEPTNGLVTIRGQVLSNVVSIAAGWAFSLAAKTDGTVIAWGENGCGQTRVPAELRDVVAVSAGADHALALKRDGTVVQWGGHASAPPSNLTNVIAIAAAGPRFERNLALKRDGTVVAWGDGSNFRDATPLSWLTNVTAIAVGDQHSLALRADGSVVGWGLNDSGQATGHETPDKPYVSSGPVTISGTVLSNIVAIAAASDYGFVGIGSKFSLALKADGSLVAWGQMGSMAAGIPAGLTNVAAIAAGQNFCVAIMTNSDSFSILTQRHKAK